MTKKEIKMAAELLRTAADTFAGYSCNDIEEQLYLGWTDKEKSDLSLYYHTKNGDPEEAEGEIKEDWIAMLAIAYKLDELGEAETEEK
jgi:hypothetical protein